MTRQEAEGLFGEQLASGLESAIRAETYTLDNKRVRVWTAGEGNPPILLLHGGGLDHALLSWRYAIPALAQTRHVIAPDWPGHGESEGVAQPYGVSDLVAWLVRLLDELGVAQADVVGVSMGGGATLGLALEHPERVRRIVPVAAYGLQRQVKWHQFSWLITRMPWITHLSYRMMRGNAAVTRAFLASLFADKTRIDDDIVQEVLEIVETPDAGRAFSLFQEYEVGWNALATCYMDRLGEIRVPALYIGGRGDSLVPIASIEMAAARTLNARLQVFNSGHWPMRELPDEFNAVITTFLA